MPVTKASANENSITGADGVGIDRDEIGTAECNRYNTARSEIGDD